MKSFLFLFAGCILACVSAAGQTLASYGPSMQAQMLVMPEHPQHASQTPLAPEQDLRERSTVIYAQGERPAWEFMPSPNFVPIAELARTFRDEHVMAKKAVVVWKDEPAPVFATSYGKNP
jgi:hypothetical protein